MLSFTAADQHTAYKKPSVAYLHIMARGLAESHALTANEIAAYFSDLTGIAANYSAKELRALATQTLRP